MHHKLIEIIQNFVDFNMCIREDKWAAQKNGDKEKVLLAIYGRLYTAHSKQTFSMCNAKKELIFF